MNVGKIAQMVVFMNFYVISEKCCAEVRKSTTFTNMNVVTTTRLLSDVV